MDHAMQLQFHALIKKLEEKFGGDGDMDLNGVLFIIGVQEVGKGFKKYSKDEKMNLIHVAICTVLEPYGFYKFTEEDRDGWPHFEKLKNLPAIGVKEQEELLKEAALNYFVENKFVNLES
jgi:hypothetical protein